MPGLRREEVASLAGVSVEYYKRMELGNASGASDSVLEALADALRLDDAERAHLFALARAASPIAPRRRSSRPVCGAQVSKAIAVEMRAFRALRGGPRRHEMRALTTEQERQESEPI